MKIYLFDAWKLKFMRPVLDHWRDLGHEVRHGVYWGPELVEWADLCYFYPVQNNLTRASKEQEKPPGCRIVAEAVDIDIYAGHWRGVKWSFVDALVCMSKHMREHMELPDSLPVHHVPGGVDLDEWTFRREAKRGYNVAWIGNFWIPKNLFGALQIFNELIQCDPGSPWRLFVRGQGWSPIWWKAHCLSYLEANPSLRERVKIIEQRIPDLNEWLEDKSFLLSTSLKEAFGYVVGEAAAKGIKPIIQNTNGALDTWPREWIFDTHPQALAMFLEPHYVPEWYRTNVRKRYPLEKRLEALDEICFGERDES